MPELINDKQTFTLLEVTRSIQKVLNERYKAAFWVKAELIKLNYYSKSGHCYPDLVEKKEGGVVAQIRANLWKTDYTSINRKFLEILGEPLKDGIKILFLAKVSYDPCYGLSLQILDIDPGYTLGDLEKEKQDTISRLKNEGIFDKNKSLKLPLLPQRIAVISVDTSKGYADFLRVIENNEWNFRFFHFLFPSILQGDKAVEGIISQLNQIRKVAHHFDVVAIIRGGGGDVGLACYNNYKLANAIVNFPLPVISGVGHATNETVAELVSHYNAITPTKLADFLLRQFHNFNTPVRNAQLRIIELSRKILQGEKDKLRSEVKFFRSVSRNVLNQNKSAIQNTAGSLLQESRFLFKSQTNQLLKFQERVKILPQLCLKRKEDDLNYIQRNIENLDPKNVLKRGYSITTLKGKSLTGTEEVSEGDLVVTQLYDGIIESIVQAKKE